MAKHFIDLCDFNKSQLRKILSFAKKIKNKPSNYHSLLKNKSIGILFEKQSTRTRVSFDIGMKNIGGNVINLNIDEIGLDKRESNSDLLNVLSQYIDCLVLRNDNHSKIKSFSKMNALSIINGLSDYSHPCQILADIFTIEEFKGKIENNIVCWIGDLNNVLISLLHAAEIFGFKLNVASPEQILNKNKFLIEKHSSKKIIFSKDPLIAAKDVDCIMTDVWVSMGKKKSEKQKKIFFNYKVNEKIMLSANKNAIFMHCLPANRKEEVDESVIDGKQSVVLRQSQNRMYVQQSIMYHCLK